MTSARLDFVGDNAAIDHAGGLAWFYEETKGALAEADLRFGNVEWPMTDIDGYDPRHHGRDERRMLPSDGAGLVEAGFDVVSLANNHMMDWGPRGLLQTLEVVDGVGVARCGAGATAAQARAPAILERAGRRIGFLAYTAVFVYPQYPGKPAADAPQMATLDVSTSYRPPPRLLDAPGTPAEVVTQPDPAGLAAVRDDIARLDSEVDDVVVSWHWGISGNHGLRVGYQREVGRACVDAGASVVVGHHPHILQGVEVYRGRPIFYSLGNFVFWYPPRLKAQHDRRSAIASVVLGDHGVEAVSLRTVLIGDDHRPRLVGGAEGARVAALVEQASADLGTSLRYEPAGVIGVTLPD